MSRFLLVVSPLQGYPYPMLAIGQQLAVKEHEAIWCGPENVLRPLAGPDATVYPTGSCAYLHSDDTGMAGLRALWDEYLIPCTRALLDPVDAAVREYRPDVVVVEQYALAGALVAHRRGVPWATVATGALEPTPPAALPGLAGFVADRVAQVVALAGLPAGEPIDPRFSPHLVIAAEFASSGGAAAAAADLAALAARARPRSADSAPRNPVEAAMVRIWADLLDTTEPVGVHDNLFGRGAGSLAAVRFVAWTGDTYGVNLAIHHIVATPTIAALAEIVAAELNSASVAETADEAELAALPDEELDDLVRALVAARDRRRAARGDGR